MEYVDLQQLTAEKLEILSLGEPLHAEYAEKIQRGLRSVQYQLAALKIASFDVEGGIEDTYADTFADLAAAELVNTFQVGEPLRSQLKLNQLGLPGRSIAERRMRAFFLADKPVTTTDVTYV